MSFKVGQKLYFVPFNIRRDGEPRAVTITKVGRKWVCLNHPTWKPYRFDKDTMQVDGGDWSSPAKCYLNKEAYESEKKLNNAWAELQDLILHSRPSKGVTLEDINKAKELLRF
ncbi:MAG: hypothetical protein GY782_08620 [Gammaproteobacteria bacterium]|nr:hypothetical protein [Gammaproteobacteria bacterium]